MSIIIRLGLLLVLFVGSFSLPAYALSTAPDNNSHSLGVGYRALANQRFTDTVGASMWIRNKGPDIALGDLKITYKFTRDGNDYYTSRIRHARFRLGSWFTSKAHIQVKDEEINIIFDKDAGIFKSGSQLDLGFSVETYNGDMFDQANDASFMAHGSNYSQHNPSIVGSKIEQMLFLGQVLDDDGLAITGATVNANGLFATTNHAGEFDLWLPPEDFIVLRVSSRDHADTIERFSADELFNYDDSSSNKTSIKSWARRRVVRMLSYGDSESFDLNDGAQVLKTIDGATLKFPQVGTNVNPIDVSLTSMHFSSSASEFYKLNQFKGTSISLGSSALQLLGVVDVVVRETAYPYRRVDLAPLDMDIEVQIPTACTNERLSPIKTWYLDESRLPPAEPVWLEHDEAAYFVRGLYDARRCFFKFTTNHFTKYAVGRVISSDFATLEFDTSSFRLQSNDIYRVEIENSHGMIRSLELLGSKLPGYRIEDVPASREVILRITNLNTGSGDGVRLPNMPDYVGQTRRVFLPKQDRLAWTSWIDRDNASGKGDYEVASYWKSRYCETPFAVEVRDRQNGQVYSSASDMPQYIQTFNRNAGFACVNSLQTSGERCHDYEIRLLCPN